MLRINHLNQARAKKVGWRVPEFAAATGISRSSVYELIAGPKPQIASVKFGGARIITTTPEDFLASLAKSA
jgi:hypothetical protein